MEAVLGAAIWLEVAKDYVNARYQHSVNRERIEWMKRLNYVFTFTYDDKKHTEHNFYKGLRRTLAQVGWEYIGVWRRGEKGKRLYFYAVIRTNGGGRYEMNSFSNEQLDDENEF